MNLSRILMVIVLCGVVHAGDSAMDPEAAREVALTQTHHADLDKRRRAYAWLGDVAHPEDLPVLLVALYDEDVIVRSNAETSIWKIWNRSGDPAADELFQTGFAQMQQGDLAQAVETFTRLILLKPDFAEAWNKRATLYFLLEDDRASARDCDEVLKRNPQHFGALAGYGQIMLRSHHPRQALEYFERALAINPNMDGVEEAVESLQEMLKDDAI
jgi:tetratricopeptide (TPR) repeat protein